MDEQAILDKLDAIAREGNWPRFDAPLGVFEYHAMRMVAVRERGGDGEWGVAFECVLGDFLDPGAANPYAANVSSYVIVPRDPYGTRLSRELPLTIEHEGERDSSSLSIAGTTLHGPAGPLCCDDSMIAELDLRPGMLCGGCDGGATDSNVVLLIRAYLARHPSAFWASIDFGGPYDVVVESDAFAHVRGSESPDEILPSESPVFRSLASAIAAGDSSRFIPGESNLDWRRWASIVDANARR